MRSAESALRLLLAALAVAALAACSSAPSRKAAAPSAASDKPVAAAAAPAQKEAAAAPTSKEAAPAPASKEAAPAAAKPAPAPIDSATQRTFDGARQALAAGRTADAERAFVALTKSHPELSGPFANLGLIHRQAAKYPEAIAALEQALSLSPQRADLHNQLGITYRMAGEFKKAKASYEQSIALDAAYAPAVLNLGILYDLYLWDGERALELYDRYLQLAPGGDDQVKRWVSDLRNRNARKNAPERKEQG
jgi:tetratricopeptide (TPR) repeat protein